MNEKLGDIGAVTVEQVETELFDVVKRANFQTKVEAAKVLLEHFDRKARPVADNTITF